VQAAGLYKGQSSTLYTVVTTSRAVEVGSGAIGRAAMVKSGSAAGRAARVDRDSSTVQALGSDSSRTFEARSISWLVNCRRIGTIGLLVRL